MSMMGTKEQERRFKKRKKKRSNWYCIIRSGIVARGVLWEGRNGRKYCQAKRKADNRRKAVIEAMEAEYNSQ